MMKAFTLAALPWILAGLAVAIICAGMDKQKSTKKEKEAEERQRQRTDPWNRCRQRTKRYKTHDWSRFSGQRVGWPVNSQGSASRYGVPKAKDLWVNPSLYQSRSVIP